MIRKSNINNILKGWFNVIRNELGVLPEDIKLESERRLKICETCIDRVNNRCGICGCTLIAKSKDPQSKCPINKWKI
jgi:hypothetical protein